MSDEHGNPVTNPQGRRLRPDLTSTAIRPSDHQGAHRCSSGALRTDNVAEVTGAIRRIVPAAGGHQKNREHAPVALAAG